MALARYTPPVVEKPACASCKVMSPECLVPVGDGALAMCWVCAHMVTEHDAKLGATARNCGCSSEEIYPPDYRARFARPQAPVSGEVVVFGGDLVYDRADPKQCTCRTLERALQGIAPHVDHGTKVARGMRAARLMRKASD
jgi:hypothetical protein